jgi:O-antigen/teichoic acid export membrane protein
MSPETTSGSDIRHLFGRDSAYIALWGLQLFLAAAFTPITTRLLGPKHYGGVAVSIAIMQVLTCIASLSLQTAVQRQFAASGERDARRLITLAAIAAAVVFVAADATGPVWAAALGIGHYSGAARYAVMWAACSAHPSATRRLV